MIMENYWRSIDANILGTMTPGRFCLPAYDALYYFDVVNDSLGDTTFLVVSPLDSIGRIKINYIFKENQYQRDSWEYESHVKE